MLHGVNATWPDISGGDVTRWKRKMYVPRCKSLREPCWWPRAWALRLEGSSSWIWSENCKRCAVAYRWVQKLWPLWTLFYPILLGTTIQYQSSSAAPGCASPSQQPSRDCHQLQEKNLYSSSRSLKPPPFSVPHLCGLTSTPLQQRCARSTHASLMPLTTLFLPGNVSQIHPD